MFISKISGTSRLNCWRNLLIQLPSFLSELCNSIVITNVMHEPCFLVLCQRKFGFRIGVKAEVFQGLIEEDAVIKVKKL